jgi:DNA-binding LacI/PurR family transcriptional regulator
MTGHHIECGSQRLALLLNLPRSQVMQWLRPSFATYDRAKGFMNGICAAGGRLKMSEAEAGQWELDPTALGRGEGGIVGELIYPHEDDVFENSFDCGRRLMLRLLRGSQLPDSLICSNDDVAIGVLSACQDAGVRVPEDIRVSGMDDAPFAKYCGVPLTTIRQPSETMAQWSVERILNLIEKPQRSKKPESVISPCQLIVRRSTVGRTSDEQEAVE